MSDDKQGRTLSDRRTFFPIRIKRSWWFYLKAVRPSSIIAVNLKRHTHINYELTQKYIDYVTGADGQTIIANYKKDGSSCFILTGLNNASFPNG